MSNKVVYFCCDVSGSMDGAKQKEVQKIINEYEENGYQLKSDMVVFTTLAKTIKLKDYRENGKCEAGGTYMSNGLREVFNNLMSKYYNVKLQDITVALIGDGDNWSEDNERVFNMIVTLKAIGVKVKYHEITLTNVDYVTRMSERFRRAGVLTHNEIEIIREPKNIIKKYSADIEVNGSLTTVRLTLDGVVKGIGVAKCNPEDKFDEALGIKIAMCRALKLNPFEKEEVTDEDILNYNRKKLQEILNSCRIFDFE